MSFTLLGLFSAEMRRHMFCFLCFVFFLCFFFFFCLFSGFQICEKKIPPPHIATSRHQKAHWLRRWDTVLKVKTIGPILFKYQSWPPPLDRPISGSAQSASPDSRPVWFLHYPHFYDDHVHHHTPGKALHEKTNIICLIQELAFEMKTLKVNKTGTLFSSWNGL